MSHKNALVQVQGHEHLPAPVERRSPTLVEDMEVARMLAESQLLPQAYRGRVGDALVAVHIARDLGVSPYLVLTNLSFVNGKPVWAAPFLIARANASGIFAEPLSFETTGEGDRLAVTCSTVVRATGKRVSKTVSLATAKEAGWTRNPLYKSIPEQLIAYRAAVFLIRLHAPSILFGLHTADEMEDVAASRGQTITYEEPEPIPSPPPSSSRRPSRPTQPAPGGVVADEEGGGSSLAPPPHNVPPVVAVAEAGAIPSTVAAPSGEDVGGSPDGASSTLAVPGRHSLAPTGAQTGASDGLRRGTPSPAAGQARAADRVERQGNVARAVDPRAQQPAHGEPLPAGAEHGAAGALAGGRDADGGPVHRNADSAGHDAARLAGVAGGHAGGGLADGPVGDPDAARAAVLAKVAELRKEVPVLLKEEAQALGLKTSPAKTPTLRLQELVAAVRGRLPLLSLPNEALHERLHAAMAEVADQDYACTIALRFGLEVVDERAVTDGAPRPWVERALVTLELVAESQRARQSQREDGAVREVLLEQAREVLREMTAAAVDEALAELSLRTLEEGTEAQLRQLVAQGVGR